MWSWSASPVHDPGEQAALEFDDVRPASGDQFVEGQLVALPFGLLRGGGPPDERRYEGAVSLGGVLLHLQGEHLGVRHLLVEELDYALQLDGDAVGDEEHPHPTRAQVVRHVRPEGVNVANAVEQLRKRRCRRRQGCQAR